MSPTAVLITVVAYFLVLIVISRLTSRGANNETFFIGNRESKWYLVAFGMIGASLSGVTFISVPGAVAGSSFSYMQIVLGYFAGYLVIANVLLPLYYRLNLTSIYAYLGERFGPRSHKTGAAFFLLSRIIGASFRLFLVAIVLYTFVFRQLNLNIGFEVTVILTVALIWIYTFKGGIKTIVWTDTLQTAFMIIAVILSIVFMAQQLEWSSAGFFKQIRTSGYAQVFFFENGWSDPKYFIKSFLSGMFITITMTGLDQDMMQKNLSCRNLGEAQKNMYWFSAVLIVVNLIFLSLGAMLYVYASEFGIVIPSKVEGGEPSADLLFAEITLNHLPAFAGIAFILGLVAAAYSSADSALTALTTSVCVDFLDIGENETRKRLMVHIGMSVVLILTIIVFYTLFKRRGSDDSLIWELFRAAALTYGPLLGLFAFGLFTKWKIRDQWVIPVCLLSPVACYFLNKYSVELLGGYQFGFELLIVNGLFTFIGLMIIRVRGDRAKTQA